MNIEGRTIWSVAAGDGAHHFSNMCIANGVIVVGPGNDGPWPDSEAKILQSGRTSQTTGNIRRLAEDIATGDLIVLHVGKMVYGVGEVYGPYHWDPRFSKVQGWDLQHSRPVRWLWKAYDKPKIFPPMTFGRGFTVTTLKAEAVRDWLETLEVAGDGTATIDTPFG